MDFDVTSISAIVAAAGVLVGVIYYVLEIRHQNRMKQTDFITRLYSTYGSKEFHEYVMEIQSLQFDDYEDFVKKYGPWVSKKPAQTAIFIVCTFFNEMGIFLRKGIIDIDFFCDIFGYTSVKWNWEKVRPVVLGLRQQLFHDPKVWKNFEYLYEEVKKREQKAGVKNG